MGCCAMARSLSTDEETPPIQALSSGRGMASEISMKVTISVAIYNVAPFIADCVRSLYEQTLDDIEILLVDDCSPDNSVEIAMQVLEQYPHRKSQVRVIRHEKNEGIAKTKCDALLEAQGEYVVVIDGDDFVDTRFAELLYQKAVDTGADMTICDFYRYRDGECKMGTLLPDGIIGDGENVRNDIINRKVSPFLVCKLFRRAFFDENDFMWPVKNIGEDTVISAETAYYAKKIAHVAEPLYYYRYNPNSVTKLLDEEHCLKNHDSFKSNVDIYVRFLEREGVSDKYGRGIFINKMRTKNRLLRIIDQRKYVRLWLRTYPEINKVVLFGNKYYKSTYREKAWFFAIVLGLFTKQKKRLFSKRFYPCNGWM